MHFIRKIYSVYFSVLFFLGVFPEPILAVRGGKRVKQELAPLVRQALPPIANTLEKSHNKNVGVMKQYRKKMIILERYSTIINYKTQQDVIRLRLKMSKADQKEVRRRVKRMKSKQRQKKEELTRHWQKAADAAGSEFHANRIIHALYPKEVTPAKNPGRQALQLVAERAGQKWIPLMQSSINLYKKQDKIQTLREPLIQAKSKGQAFDKSLLSKLTGQEDLYSRRGRHAHRDAMVHLWTNRALALTVKGVNPVQLQPHVVQSLRKWAKAYPSVPRKEPEQQKRS